MNEVTRDDLPSAHEVANKVREALGVEKPVVGLILGSGLGGLVKRIEDMRFVPYADVHGFAVPTIPGHLGRLICGTLGGRQVIALAGRFHVYEGHSAAESAFPVRVLHALGASTLFLSNAAGGIRRSFKPGDLMIIRDHVNLTGHNPLIGPVVAGDERFPDMSEPYDPELRKLLAECAKVTGVPVSEGVYIGLSGPSYETPAEVRMLELFGVDAVGMSTVHEVIVARAIGMRVAGMSCITNLAAGLCDDSITHDDVLEITKAAGEKFEQIAIEFVKRL